MEELKSAILAAITEILQQEIDVTLKSLRFQRVVEQELDEDGLAEVSDWLEAAVDHHFLDPFDDVIDF